MHRRRKGEPANTVRRVRKDEKKKKKTRTAFSHDKGSCEKDIPENDTVRQEKDTKKNRPKPPRSIRVNRDIGAQSHQKRKRYNGNLHFRNVPTRIASEKCRYDNESQSEIIEAKIRIEMLSTYREYSNVFESCSNGRGEGIPT